MKEQKKLLDEISTEIAWRCRAKSVMSCVGTAIFIAYPILMGLYIIYASFEKYGSFIKHIPLLNPLMRLLHLMLSELSMPTVVLTAVIGTICIPLVVCTIIYAVMYMRRKSCSKDSLRDSGEVSEKDRAKMLMSMCDGMKKFNGKAGIALSGIFFFVLTWIGISLIRYGAAQPENANFLSSVPFVIMCLVAYLLIICPIVVFISDMMAGIMFLMYRCPAETEKELLRLCENFNEKTTESSYEHTLKVSLPKVKIGMKKES